METKREAAFCRDRYYYDFGQCSLKNGYAQLDTGSDASYYGTWANPNTLTIVNYCEGEEITKTCENVEEFVAEIRKTADWHVENDGKFAIDAYIGEVADKFKEIGLGDLLH